ncbi:hypothetical protein [Actinoplanes sp. L3-i22]|uniref:hypothetical protein n=1 Tax=Actinoplanes sp. L3-i22 TaxID=2836373 RepID=UPI001C747D8D|nr:hypothetical protein [Actinoplanes sp. L3-i22]BCY12671.1 hypothetical protein L3i22_077590 [Actinoplanes sp. L3-i22]
MEQKLPGWVDLVLRGRWVAAALAATLLALFTTDQPFDLADFAAYGQRILDGHLSGVYEDGWNQAGPVQLLVSWLLMIGGSTGTPAAAVRVAVNVGLALGAMALCRRLNTGTGRPAGLRETATGLLVLLWLAVPVPWYGHPAELLVPVLWSYASVLHRRERTGTAAALLGVSVAIAPWAILGFPCLLAVTGLRRAIRAWILAGAVGVAFYLPFVLAGNFHMFSHVWRVDDDTLIRLLFPDLATVTWPLRLVQAVLVAGTCAAVAYRFRGQRVVYAAAPAAASLIRIFSDPVSLRYYWITVAVATVLAFVLVSDAERPRRQLLALLLGYLAAFGGLATRQVPGTIACLVVLAALLIAGETRKAVNVAPGDTVLTPRA